MSVGDRLRAARKAKGLTQEEVAKEFGISRAAVAQWESGANSPDPDKMPALARLYDQSLDALFADSPAPIVSTAARLMGYAGARDAINVPEGERDDLGTIDGPSIFPDGWEAVIVTGRSMLPVYRPQDVLFFRRREYDLAGLYGADCVVETERGRRYVKVVRRGRSARLVDLESYDAAIEPLRDVELRWAAPIEVVQRGGVRRR